jgi:hypothetical protein
LWNAEPAAEAMPPIAVDDARLVELNAVRREVDFRIFSVSYIHPYSLQYGVIGENSGKAFAGVRQCGLNKFNLRSDQMSLLIGKHFTNNASAAACLAQLFFGLSQKHSLAT